MDRVLSVALPAQGWAGNRIRFILAGDTGREVWEVTLDRLQGTGEAAVIGPLALREEVAEARANLADESSDSDAEVSDEPESLPDEADVEDSV